MNALQLELTRLIGKKELAMGCVISSKQFSIYWDEYKEWTINRCTWFHNQGNVRLEKFRVMNPHTEEDEWFEFTDCTSYKIIGHPATLSDFHRWMNENLKVHENWRQNRDLIIFDWNRIEYNSYKDLLDQDEETLKQIVELISSNK